MLFYCSVRGTIILVQETTTTEVDMKHSISKNQIVENFAEVDGLLSVVAFDMRTQRRTMSIGGLNPLRAISEVARFTARGLMVHVCLDLPTGISIIRDYAEFMVKAHEYFWKPDYWFGQRK